MNHREGERIPTDIPLTLYALDRGPIEARLMNLSLSGAMIRCDVCVGLNVCTPVELWMELRGNRLQRSATVQGFVTRRDGHDIGIMFMQNMLWLVRNLRALGATASTEQSAAGLPASVMRRAAWQR